MSKKPTMNGLPIYNPWSSHGAKTPNWLLRRSDVSANAKHVYARLAQFAGKNGSAYPRVKTLAAEIGISTRVATNCLRELREKRLLTVDSGAVEGKANRYFFVEHEWKLEQEYDIEMGVNGVPDRAPEVDEDDEEGGKKCSHQVGRNVPTGVGRNVPTGYEDSFLQNIDQGIKSEKESNQRDAGDADAPPSLSSPQPKGKTLAPALGSYSERAARPPDAEHEFDPSNGSAGLEQKKVDLAEKKRKRTDAQLAKDRARAQALANLASDGKATLTPEQKEAVKRLQNVWVPEMRQRFPDLTIARWDGRNWGQAWKLIEKYDGESAAAAVKYVVRRWGDFSERYFKGKGTVPTIGMILNLHETIVPVAVQWEKHADTLEEWEKFYAENPYEDPPAELEKKYRAAKAKLTQLGLA